MKKNLLKFEAYLISAKGLKQILGGYGESGGGRATCYLYCPGKTIERTGRQCASSGDCMTYWTGPGLGTEHKVCCPTPKPKL